MSSGENSWVVAKKATRCQSLIHSARARFLEWSPPAIISGALSLASSLTTPSMDWSSNPGRFPMWNFVERNNGALFLGNPWLTYEQHQG